MFFFNSTHMCVVLLPLMSTNKQTTSKKYMERCTPQRSDVLIYVLKHFFSTMPTAAAPHRCLTFGQKWRSIELCRSDRIIRNEESKAGTTIG